ncbi:MAG: hypothetical protein ACJ76H_12290 [Bacteriovoracaceae bacterium]
MRPFIMRFFALALVLPILNVGAEDCRYSRKKLTKIDSDRESNELRDFVDNDRYGDDWACLMKARHLKADSLKNCLPPEEDVMNSLPDHKMLIEGKIRYMGFIPQDYRYEISPDGIEVRIAFTGELASDEKILEDLRTKFNYASEVWTKNSPGGKIPFHFKLVGLNDDPHFTPKLVKKAKGTKFNSLWDIEVSKMVVAHEVGHMLGLDDEYPVIRSMVWQVKNDVDTRMCNVRSLMCDYYSSQVKLYPYVYYQILRRPHCLRNQ